MDRKEITNMESMRIWDLQEYAKDNGYDSGRFICVNEKGTFEMKWLDAYYGFVIILEPKQEKDGFVTVEKLIELFGREQKYIPTIGYD